MPCPRIYWEYFILFWFDYYPPHWISSRSLTFPPCSTNMNEVSVTIAGSVCDVKSANNTHIICVTNSQRQSQETKVRVSIGDGGVAKMVREDSQNVWLHSQHGVVSVSAPRQQFDHTFLFVSFFRIMQISSTLTCGRPGSRGAVCLHLRRALLPSSPKDRPSCWTPTPLCWKCSLFKVEMPTYHGSLKWLREVVLFSFLPFCILLLLLSFLSFHLKQFIRSQQSLFIISWVQSMWHHWSRRCFLAHKQAFLFRANR